MNSISIVLSPELVPSYTTAPATCVVIDVLRASTTIVTAFEHGVRKIYPLESVEEAMTFAKEGKLVGAERNALRCDFAQLGNDPLEYTQDKVEGKEIYFTTTNGTRSIQICMHQGHEVLVGTFVNLAAVADRCRGKDVLAVCAGWKGQVCTEDALFAAALVEQLADTHAPLGDATHMMLELWRCHKSDLETYVITSEHYPRLVRAGKESTLTYCLTPSTMQSVPTAYLTENGLIELRID